MNDNFEISESERKESQGVVIDNQFKLFRNYLNLKKKAIQEDDNKTFHKIIPTGSVHPFIPFYMYAGDRKLSMAQFLNEHLEDKSIQKPSYDEIGNFADDIIEWDLYNELTLRNTNAPLTKKRRTALEADAMAKLLMILQASRARKVPKENVMDLDEQYFNKDTTIKRIAIPNVTQKQLILVVTKHPARPMIHEACIINSYPDTNIPYATELGLTPLAIVNKSNEKKKKVTTTAVRVEEID